MIDRVLDPFADHVQLPLERLVVGDCGRAADEEVLEERLRRDRPGPEVAIVGRHVTPAEERLPFLVDDPGDRRFDRVPRLRLGRQEHEPGAIPARRRQRDPQARRLGTEEPIRHLNQDAGAVPGIRFAAAGAAMLEIDQDLQGMANDRVRTPSLGVDDEADTAGVVLVTRVIQAVGGGGCRCGHTMLCATTSQKENRFYASYSCVLLVDAICVRRMGPIVRQREPGGRP